MMTREERREKRNWFLFLTGYFAAGYLVINWISSKRVSFFDLETATDRAIPFIPEFIFGYILVYLSVVLVYFVIDDYEDWLRAAVSFFAATTFAYLIFLILPVKMNLRPDLAGLSGFSAEVTKFYYFIDMPYNCFPSLHVTYPTLVTLASWRSHKLMRLVFLAMTIIVAVSVVLVKQHYIADVVAGFANAGLMFYLAVKFENRWACYFKPLSAARE